MIETQCNEISVHEHLPRNGWNSWNHVKDSSSSWHRLGCLVAITNSCDYRIWMLALVSRLVIGVHWPDPYKLHIIRFCGKFSTQPNLRPHWNSEWMLRYLKSKFTQNFFHNFYSEIKYTHCKNLYVSVAHSLLNTGGLFLVSVSANRATRKNFSRAACEVVCETRWKYTVSGIRICVW